MTLDDRSDGRSIRVRIWQLAVLSCCALAILGSLAVWDLARGRDADERVEADRLARRLPSSRAVGWPG